MPWEQVTVRYWTVCWKWIFPYPCRKSKNKYCCTGRWKQRCYLFYGEQWLCCDGREGHYWAPCFGIGDTTSARERVCRDSIPESRDGCPTTGGVAPPGAGANYARAALSVGSGSVIWGVVGALIALAAVGVEEMVTGAIGGAIVGAVFGASSGRRCGWLITLIVLVIVLLLIWFGVI